MTPDAFRVAPDLLGVPLASPSRRAAALAIDLFTVALLSSLGMGALTTAVGGFLIRFGRKGARRASSRLGAIVGGVLLVLLGLVMISSGPVIRFAAEPSTESSEGAATGWDLLALLDDDPGKVRSAAQRLAEGLRASGGTREEAEAALADLAARFPVGPEREQWIREGLAAGFAVEPTSSVEGDPESREVAAAGAFVHAAEAGQAEAQAAARAELRNLLAGAELEALAEENRKLGQREREARARLEAERARPVSILAQARAVAEDIGITFFWSTLYFTTFVGLFRGRTPGKRLLGLRVVRLDGARLSVWNAFERHSGYLAGTATGLLGFLQVFWDPNRQAIQDKIAGTVVIRVGQPKILD